MKHFTANFYPAAEEKNGYIGKANITIANAIRINGISVFRNQESGLNLHFPGFGDDASYVVPKSKDVYAAMRGAVAMAVESEKHFGYSNGENGIRLEVSGKAVQEPHADGRFSVNVGDVCTLYGITTKPVDYEKEGKASHFVSVNMPIISTYENAAGEKQYRPAFEGRTSVWTDKEGQEHKRDYAQLLNGLVLSERKELMKDRKPGLDEQMKDAEGRKAAQPAHEAPAKEAERG